MMWLVLLIILSSLILAIASGLDRWFRRDHFGKDWTWRASLAAMILMVPLGWLRPWSAQVTCYLPILRQLCLASGRDQPKRGTLL